MSRPKPAPLETHAALATIEQALDLLATVDRAAIPGKPFGYSPRFLFSQSVQGLRDTIKLTNSETEGSKRA